MRRRSLAISFVFTLAAAEGSLHGDHVDPSPELDADRFHRSDHMKPEAGVHAD